MARINALQWATLVVPSLLRLPQLAAAAPATQSQVVLQPHTNPGSEQPLATSQRRLRGRFLHITDLHPDEHYKPHTSTEEGVACHRDSGLAGVYGAETSDCDSPLSLIDATLAWVKEHLKDEIDFVVWTGDSARHDSDEELPRHNEDILSMNRRIADAMVDTFSDDTGLVIPVVPTFGNNDIYPHNILMPGPNEILRTYSSIWRQFIPEFQRHSFEFGGWFYVEVIPNQLAVFSLNTMYFFDRNAGIDDCVQPSEPGYKHFEWLLVQLQNLRNRGMKAILMGHVPPARTAGKQLWDETCWQKYTLWLQQYRDVIVGSLYGHMNIDHFLLQDTREIDMDLISGAGMGKASLREAMEDDLSIQSSAGYLRELRDDWAKLPDPIALDKDVDDAKKRRGKDRKGKDRLGGKWAERFQLSLISPSVVPNYFPSLRVFEYNITGIENNPSWMDAARAAELNEAIDQDEIAEVRELKARDDTSLEIEQKKKKKGHKSAPGDPNRGIPSPPAKGAPPGPAYSPQTLTLLGYTQYFANLTYINNDVADEPQDGDVSSWGWNPGKHSDKTPKHKPQPREFQFEVEYSTFDDKIYGLQDLTVKSFVRLAHRIGQASRKSDELTEAEDLLDDATADDAVDEYNDDSDDDSGIWKFFKGGKNKKHKKDKKKDKKKKKERRKKARKTWLHFLKHAFVGTKSKDELKEM
ncbi:Metallo-dependent phosphatase-like protein [Nemania sp. FL0916]|nr:Metallo-dependent phosphatase-like protein [Nemania sp. FL0916]